MDASVFIALVLELLPPLLPDLIQKCASGIISEMIQPLIAPLQKEIKELRAEIKSLKSKAEQQEGQDRRNNLRFKGIPERAHETWADAEDALRKACLLYTSPSPRDLSTSRMPSSA